MRAVAVSERLEGSFVLGGKWRTARSVESVAISLSDQPRGTV
jgi:hypothetical protein